MVYVFEVKRPKKVPKSFSIGGVAGVHSLSSLSFSTACGLLFKTSLNKSERKTLTKLVLQSTTSMSSDVYCASHSLVPIACSVPHGSFLCNPELDDTHRIVSEGVRTVSRRSSINDSLSVLNLPVPCLERIFSYLEPCERGHCATVCSTWHHIMRSPRLWQNVDLNIFPVCQVGMAASMQHVCGVECYPAYHERVLKYIRYLTDIRPIVHQLHFAFDLDEDGWHKELDSLLKACRLSELQVAHIRWNETRGKPFTGLSHTIAASDFEAFKYRHRHRQRLFVHFFEYFTAAAPNVVKLRLPFDWSDRSVNLLGRLRNLRSVVLEKYSVFQALSQETLDMLCQNLPNVTRLIVEVYIPSGRGMQVYSIRGMSRLTYLDISQCRGFYLGSLDLPALQTIKVSRHPWNGPLVMADAVQLPCLYPILCSGTPTVTQLNEHTLKSAWSDDVYPELESILQIVCSCRSHKRSWMM